MEIQFQATAHKYGYSSVHELKKKVALKIKEYVAGGGFMFAMCSATDSFDIALAAQNVDIAGTVYDNSPVDPSYQIKMDHNKTRYPIIDQMRGLAVALMIIFHLLLNHLR